MEFWEKIFYIFTSVFLLFITALLAILIFTHYSPIRSRIMVVEVHDKREQPKKDNDPVIECIEEGIDGWKMWSIDHP